MNKIFKVGLIGCGHISETYFRAEKYFNNIKITKIALLILYYINLKVVSSYISTEFLSYIDYTNFTFVDKYFDVFCALLILISVNYLILSYYAKVNSSYNNIHLNNLCKRLLSSARD